MTDDLPFDLPGAAPAMLAPAKPRTCRHPRQYRGSLIVDGQPIAACSRCGHVINPDAARRGRNARYNGKRQERVEMRKAGIHTGNANQADDGLSVDGLFAYQSKALSTARFPGWQAAELDKLRTAHAAKVPVLLMVELPGRGRKPRKLAVVEWSDWLDLHGGAR